MSDNDYAKSVLVTRAKNIKAKRMVSVIKMLAKNDVDVTDEKTLITAARNVRSATTSTRATDIFDNVMADLR